jgi:hypothetical protein
MESTSSQLPFAAACAMEPYMDVSGNGCETTSKYHVTVLAAADKSAEADLL